MKRWTEREKLELSELFHLAHCYGKHSRYERKLWAAQAYEKQHPDVSSTAAYKQLCREEAWRF